MTEHSDDRLIHHTKETYGSSFDADLLEQYKLYVESVDNVSARRVSSARYLLTINAALVALYGFQPASSGQLYLLLPISIIGIAVSLLSYNIIRSHRNLNRVKFDIIQELERHLPAGLYAYEWRMLEEGRGKVYRPVSHIEQWIPIVFAVLHILAFVFVVVFMTTGLPSWAK